MAIRITSNTRPAIFRPTTKDELQSLIEQELERQGWDADLNFIDTSLITDMSWLFHPLYYVRNIKIDEWDVSNVTNMESMFRYCKNFMEHTAFHYAVNCDLSGWDVSNVENMSSMFLGCNKFNSDLSSWDVSNVRVKMEMFWDCPKMESKPHLQPKFN
jgi:surface protein